MKKKPDWAAIRMEYCTSKDSPTKRELCEKYGIPRRTMEDRARREEWSRKREEFRGKVVAEAFDAAGKTRAGDLACLIKAVDKLSDIAEKAADVEYFLTTRVVRDGTGMPVLDDDGNPITETVLEASKLRAVAAALKDLAATGRDLYGIPTKAEEVKLEQERVRLELDQARLELERRRLDNTGPGEIRVVLGDAERFAR